MNSPLEVFKNAHKWLIIPFLIAIIGFSNSYFLRFSEATWHQHMHGLSALLWYVMVIVQPYLISKGRIDQHRFYGLLSIFLAGAVTFSAITIIAQNIESANTYQPDPLIPKEFFYGVCFTDLLTTIGFGASVIMGIVTRKSIEDHAFWMISTVFWAIMPALSRLGLMPMLAIYGYPPPFDLIDINAFVAPLVVLTILFICWRLKKWHPSLIIVAIATIPFLFLRQLGSNKIWQEFVSSLLKY